MKSVNIFGVEVTAGSREELFLAVANMIGSGGAVSTVNPEILYASTENEELRAALLDSVCIPDGIGVVNTARRMGVFSEHFPGVELGEALLTVFSVRLGIIGGKSGVSERAMKNLSAKYPSVTPVFAFCGYNINEEEIKNALKRERPDIVFVCLGSPKQEIFINEIKRYSENTLFVALGGSVDIYAGDKRRAPKLVRRLHGEWIYRILTEPKRVKRLPKLLLYAIKNKKNTDFDEKSCKIGKKRKKSV